MRRSTRFVRILAQAFSASAAVAILAAISFAAPGPQLEYTSAEDEIDLPLLEPQTSKVLQDTVWIADWTFDSGGGCTETGWVKLDNRVLNHGENYWTIDNRFAGTGCVSGRAAVLSKHDLCWVSDGYGNDWDFSMLLRYEGAGATLSFCQVADTEADYDFITVEADSLGLSESRTNICLDPATSSADLRTQLTQFSGFDTGSVITALPLPNFGAGTHEVHIRFRSDGAYSDEDGEHMTLLNAAIAIDNVVVTGALAYTENFEGSLNSNITLANTGNTQPFCDAPWIRLFSHLTDNDKCTENTTCAWLPSDPLRIAFFPSMAFGPGQAVVHNWLDDIIVSPWVSLASTPQAVGTVLSFRRLGANIFTQSKIAQAWRIRAKFTAANTDTPTDLTDTVDCVSPWGHAASFTTFSNANFNWITSIADATAHYPVGATEVQVSLRWTDWQYIHGDVPPVTLNTGPGPYTDRIRLGRRIRTGPVINVGIDTRTQAQDAFPTVQNGIAPGQHFSPDGSNRFGSCAFSCGFELRSRHAGPVVTGDSIQLQGVLDFRGAGGINNVRVYAAVTSGPHAGKAPAPYSVGGNGFFSVNADSVRGSHGVVIANAWFIDLDDTYFRGGDVLNYVWVCTDNGGGVSSAPTGLGAVPSSVSQAEIACTGLYEVSYLPAIDWSPAYLARIAADAHGDLDPTPDEVAASSQRNCILYYQKTISSRRSGPLQRTSFMYTLDRLGYDGDYDVYDVQGYGNTNNALGGRANAGQCVGYGLVILDGFRSALAPTVEDGSSSDGEKVNQAQWFRDYLALGGSGGAGSASVWIIGENAAFQKPTNPLFTVDMGLSSIVTDQGIAVNPDVRGGQPFTFAGGSNQNFVGDEFSLQGGCPTFRTYDGATSTGTAVVTHNYAAGTMTGMGAVIMNRDATAKWNTVWQGFGWPDIRDPINGPPGQAELTLMRKVFLGTLGAGCLESEDPTGVPGDPEIGIVPARTALHQNVPNPFNPTTRISFDLARPGHVELRVLDVAGRVVKTLANEHRAAGRHEVLWTGSTDRGGQAASGVYIYQMSAGEFRQTRKLMLLK